MTVRWFGREKLAAACGRRRSVSVRGSQVRKSPTLRHAEAYLPEQRSEGENGARGTNALANCDTRTPSWWLGGGRGAAEHLRVWRSWFARAEPEGSATQRDRERGSRIPSTESRPRAPRRARPTRRGRTQRSWAGDLCSLASPTG